MLRRRCNQQAAATPCEPARYTAQMTGLLILLSIALALVVALLAAILARDMVRPARRTAAYAIARNLPCDPGDLGLDFEQWELDRPDGAVLPVWEIRTNRDLLSDQPPNQTTLTAVFVYGWGHSRIDTLSRIGLFLPLVDRIVLYDLRGHGDAEGSLSRLGDGEQYDLLALLERLGEGRFLLVGHSMGAVIAITAAHLATRDANHPLRNRIAGVIAYGPYCEFHQSLQGRLRHAGYPTRPMTDLALLVHRLRGVRPLSLNPHDLRTLGCPLLVIHGELDNVAPLEHGRRIAAAAKEADCQTIAGAGHTDAHLVDAERHDALVQDFVKRLEGGMP